jgi:hypothetical protein
MATPMTVAKCLWCGTPFKSRTVGAHRKRFCSTICKDAYHEALKKWAHRTIESGGVTVADLKAL